MLIEHFFISSSTLADKMIIYGSEDIRPKDFEKTLTPTANCGVGINN